MFPIVAFSNLTSMATSTLQIVSNLKFNKDLNGGFEQSDIELKVLLVANPVP